MRLVLSVIIGVVFELGTAMPVKYYASRYDHVDVETIINNRRLVKSYSQCLLSKGPCPPEGIEFKRILPEALETSCARCTEKQKTVTLRIIKRLKKEYPKIWSELSAEWDPDDIFVKKFESTYSKKKIPSDIPQIFNRFSDDENNISESPTAKVPSSIVSSSTPPIILSSTSSLLISSSAPVRPSTIRTDMQRLPNLVTSKPFIPDRPSSSSTITSTLRSTTSKSTTVAQTYTNKSLIVTYSTTNVPNIRQNIGANIQATVAAFKNMERRLALMAKKKLEIFSRLLSLG